MTKSSAVTLKIDDKPGDTPLDMVVSTLQMKLDSDTLLVDPSFGNLILTKVDWPEGWGEGKDKNSGVAGTDARPPRAGWETPRSRRGSIASISEGGSDTTEGGEAFRGLSAGAPRRLVLISSRMYFADVLVGASRLERRRCTSLAILVARENSRGVQGPVRRRSCHAAGRHHDPPQAGRDRSGQGWNTRGTW